MADALVRTLNAMGYQPVFLPRSGVQPPELYHYLRDQRRLVRIGSLAGALPAAAALVPSEGTLGDINTQYTSEKKLDAAVSFLETALKCIGIDAAPKIDLGFAGSRNFAFAFTGVTYRSIDPAQLYPLVDALNTQGMPKEYIEDGRLHIAYEYAYATELLMSRGDRLAFHADIQGKVGSFFDLGGKGSVSLASTTTVSFKGDAGVRAAFAYKAGQLVKERGHWVFYPEEVMRSGLVETRKPYVAQPAVVLSVMD